MGKLLLLIASGSIINVIVLLHFLSKLTVVSVSPWICILMYMILISSGLSFKGTVANASFTRRSATEYVADKLIYVGICTVASMSSGILLNNQLTSWLGPILTAISGIAATAAIAIGVPILSWFSKKYYF